MVLGEWNVKKIIHNIRSNIEKKSTMKIEYIECVDVNTLKPLKIIQNKVMIALAVKCGKTRLIDNIIFKI